MAKRLDAFPGEPAVSPRRYPWDEWTDGSAWEIRRGGDYDVETENMRVNLHMKATAQNLKVRTQKISDNVGEGLVFQFFQPEDTQEAKRLLASASDDEVAAAMEQLYADAMDIYERARAEVTIPRSDGRTQKYAAVRYKQQIEKAGADPANRSLLVPAIASIIKKRTSGFNHLDAARRPDLMVETLVLDRSKPYHRFFASTTLDAARKRLDEHGYAAAPS